MKKLTALILCLVMLFAVAAPVMAADTNTIAAAERDMAAYIYQTVPDPQVGSIGGEWAVLGLARSSADISSEYYQKYYQTLEKYVKIHNGVLSEKKYTEYARISLAVTAIGRTAQNVAGYNLLEPLADYEKVVLQGLNGPVWALIALDSANYPIPQNQTAKVQATRQMYVDYILSRQTADGGWAFSGDEADIDMTAMALQALSKYRDRKEVQAAVDKALLFLSANQDACGGFTSWGAATSESTAQVVVALCELGIAADDARFTKDGHTAADNLLIYYEKGKGFKHTIDGESNQMASEQGFYALAALDRLANGKSSLYRMTDVAKAANDTANAGLSGKNPAVKRMPIVYSGKSFSDISGLAEQSAIEALAVRNIVNGKTTDAFVPTDTMSRAEFAAIMVKGLGLKQRNAQVFKDVKESDWFYTAVNTAYYYGIVKGVAQDKFNPNGTITREEAAAMITRAAALCGIETEMSAASARDILAGFADYTSAASWARTSLAFCYKEKIMDDSALKINPKEKVSRAQIAQMLYNLLAQAELL